MLRVVCAFPVANWGYGTEEGNVVALPMVLPTSISISIKGASTNYEIMGGLDKYHKLFSREKRRT